MSGSVLLHGGHRQAGEPRLSERTGVPHLWLRHGGGAGLPVAFAEQHACAVCGRRGAYQRAGIDHRLGAEKTVPHLLVGLF